MNKTQNNNLLPRPPIVVILGHVDHGKTTLLDFIRKTNVAVKEIGGITQSIGAYEIIHAPHESQINADYTQINADNISVNQRNNQSESAFSQHESAPAEGRKITFIDTPGHEAFSKMREHGAKIADLAILVVAADEGVKPQTKEALEHIKSENLPFIVAINKIDKPEADVEKTKNQLLQNGVFLEGLGGNIPYQLISAKTGEGVNELLDLILLAAELEDLKYNPKAEPEGFVISVRPDPYRGLGVGVIITNGILKTNQGIATATAKGKIKILENFLGKKVDQLEAGSPAFIFGFENQPLVGETFKASEQLEISEKEKNVLKPQAKEIKNISFPQKEEFQKEESVLTVILKTDEAGSLDALEKMLSSISQEIPEVTIKIIDRSIGNIFENDIKLASSGKAIIIAFHSRANQPIKNLAQILKVKIISSDIIYELEKQIKELIKQKLTPFKRRIQILKIFGERQGKQQIVGGRVLEGPIKNKESFEIWFNDKYIGQGKILNLQSQKKDIDQAEKNQEIGLLIESDVFINSGYHLLL